MTGIDEALVEKVKQAILDAYFASDYAQAHGITEASDAHHEHAEAYARAALAAVSDDLAAAARVEVGADREALATALLHAQHPANPDRPLLPTEPGALVAALEEREDSDE